MAGAARRWYSETGWAGYTLVLTLVLWFNLDRPGLFSENQNSYFAHGLRWAGVPGLERDWYSNTESLHFAFSGLIRFLESHGKLSGGVSIVLFLLYVGLVASIVMMLVKLNRCGDGTSVSRFHSLPEGAVTAAALLFWLPVIFGKTLGGLWQLWGFAGQYVFHGYLQPSEFGILACVGLSALAWHHWKIAGLAFGVASMFHSGYFVHGLIVMVTAVVWMASRSNDRHAVWALFIFLVLGVPNFANTAAMLLSGQESTESLRILASERVSHHAFPQMWWTPMDAVRAIVIGGATLVLFVRGVQPLGWIFLSASLYGALGILVVLGTANVQVAMSFPWRASVFLYPLSLAILCWLPIQRGAHAVCSVGDGPRLWIRIGVLGIVILSIARGFLRGPQQLEPAVDEVVLLGRQTQHVTRHSVLVIVPVEGWEMYRLASMRAVFVDFKSHPYRPDEVLEWARRVSRVKSLYELPLVGRRAQCRKLGATHYVERTDFSISPEFTVARTNNYRLVRCVPSDEDEVNNG